MNENLSINPLSPFDQAEKIFIGLVKQLKDAEFQALLDKYNEEFAAAEPTNELTDKGLKAIEEAKAADQLQRKCEYARNLSKAIMKRMSDTTDSELFKTAKKILDLLDEIESGNKSRWRELDTTTYTLVQLCRAKRKQPAETEKGATPAKRRWMPTCICKIFEKGWQIFTKSFWESLFERMWPK